MKLLLSLRMVQLLNLLQVRTQTGTSPRWLSMFKPLLFPVLLWHRWGRWGSKGRGGGEGRPTDNVWLRWSFFWTNDFWPETFTLNGFECIYSKFYFPCTPFLPEELYFCLLRSTFKAPGLNHYCIVFNILDMTSQERDLTELRFLWPGH